MAKVKVERRSVMGAVLAGGSSRRMGRDKALLEVDGESLLSRALNVLCSVLEEVVVVAPRRQGYPTAGVEMVPDLRPGSGPLGGLHAALVRAAGEPVFVLACDMPGVRPELVELLLDATERGEDGRRSDTWRTRARARVPVDQGRAQPLCALYGGGCREVIERVLDAGRFSVHALLDELEVAHVGVDQSLSWYHADLFANVNDLERYTELIDHSRQIYSRTDS